MQHRLNRFFRHYRDSRGLQDRIKTYWGIHQGDKVKLREIVAAEFVGPLDLVLDDCSHLYDHTRDSFEALFPLLRPGGLYIIEDWSWAHKGGANLPGWNYEGKVPLTQLIFELVEAAGTSRLIGSLTVFQDFAVVERGACEVRHL